MLGEEGNGADKTADKSLADKNTESSEEEENKYLGCDSHAQLALGLIDEDKKGKKSQFFHWIELLPKAFSNCLWFNEDQVRRGGGK